MPPVTRYRSSFSKARRNVATIVFAVFGLVVLLRTQGKTLRNDWSPVGIGIKFVLLACVGALMYYPYELFFQGNTAVTRAIAMP